MNTPRDPCLAAAEPLNDGLVLKFNDGQCAFFSCQLLLAVLAQADPLDEEAIAW